MHCEWFQSVCQSQCFKVVCSHWSHCSYPRMKGLLGGVQTSFNIFWGGGYRWFYDPFRSKWGVRETLAKIPLKSTSGMQQFQGGVTYSLPKVARFMCPPLPLGVLTPSLQKFFVKKFTVKKNIWSKNKFWSKQNFDEHFFWSRKVLVKKLFWHTKFLVKKIFG